MPDRRPAEDLGFYRLDAGEPPPEGPFVALVPGAEAPLLELDLPEGLSGPAREDVARRMLADRIGSGENGSAAEIRPCVIAGADPAWRRVIVADAARLGGWRAALASHGSRARALLPDYLALPGAEGLWTVEGHAGGVVARLGLDDGFAAEDALAALMLACTLEDGAAPRAVLRLGAPAPETDAVLAEAGLRVVSDPAALNAEGDPRPARLAHRELWLDLATDLGATTDRLHRTLTAWRLPLAMALAALAIWVGAEWQAIAEARERGRAARLEAEALTRTHFVPEGPILDIQAQVARAIADAEAQAGPSEHDGAVALFRTAAGVIVARQARLVHVVWQDGAGLTLEVETGDFAALDQLVAAIAALGPSVTLAEAAAREEGGVAGVMTLRSEVTP